MDGDGKKEIIAGSNGLYIFDYNSKKLYSSDDSLSVNHLWVANLEDDGYMEIILASGKNLSVYTKQTKGQSTTTLETPSNNKYCKEVDGRWYIMTNLETPQILVRCMADQTCISTNFCPGEQSNECYESRCIANDDVCDWTLC